MTESDKFWDKKAQAYAASPIADQAAYQRKLSETQSHFTTDMRVLEFGCGTGTTAIEHAPHVRHIDAIDVSESMLKIGHEKAAQENIENVRFSRGTLIDFNAQSESIDVILAMSVIHLLPNRKETLVEVARILKPGGVFISSTACLGDSYLRFIKLVAPLGKMLGLIPTIAVFKQAQLAREIESHGFKIESQWHHGMKNVSVFLVARKIQENNDRHSK